MEPHHQRNKPDEKCLNPSCFFCAMNHPDPFLRKAKLTKCFREIPLKHHQHHVLALSSLWTIAMKHPNDPEFPPLGIFECMANLIQRAIADTHWLLRDHNIYIPYYAAHIIGTYAMNKPQFAETAVKSGVVPPLMELLRGKISWVEQRVAVRALGHIASHEITFEAVSVHETEIIELTMEIVCTCLDVIYTNFVGLKEKKRLKYHRVLITRGAGGLEIENRKAEEWASQLQRWSLYLLNCFVCEDKSINLITNQNFLKHLCAMWGGVANRSSPSGIGLIRSLCHTKTGRKGIAESEEAVRTLCNLSRSSDKWQYLAIDCLLLILKDPDTRFKILDVAVLYLADLVELRRIQGRATVGEAITQTLLRDFYKIKYRKLKLKSKSTRAERTLEEIWDLKVERRKREKLMSEEEERETKILAGLLKQEGNQRFWCGDIEEAVIRYSKALDLCPLRMRKERTVLYSNRAQCHLLLRDPESAISDATRALCLSMNSHSKSLWRRSQAYDMRSLARESLTDCLKFVNGRMKSERTRGVKIPYYAARMISKQMNATWLFADARTKARINREAGRESNGQDHLTCETSKENKKTSSGGMPVIAEEPSTKIRRRRRKLERSGRTRN